MRGTKGTSELKKTINLSSRIEPKLYEELTKMSSSKGISMNSLVNSILKRHMIWDQFFEDMGLVPITKRTIKKLFRNLEDEAIKKIATDVGGTVPQELIYLSYDKFDFHNLMNMIELSDSRFGKVNYSSNGQIYNINILHGICINFSKFLVETHQSLAEQLSMKFHVEHIDNNMVCLEFEKPDYS